jgi:hypothetical protein
MNEKNILLDIIGIKPKRCDIPGDNFTFQNKMWIVICAS